MKSLAELSDSPLIGLQQHLPHKYSAQKPCGWIMKGGWRQTEDQGKGCPQDRSFHCSCLKMALHGVCGHQNHPGPAAFSCCGLSPIIFMYIHHGLVFEYSIYPHLSWYSEWFFWLCDLIFKKRDSLPIIVALKGHSFSSEYKWWMGKSTSVCLALRCQGHWPKLMRLST